jgi:hypothetical protein
MILEKAWLIGGSWLPIICDYIHITGLWDAASKISSEIGLRFSEKVPAGSIRKQFRLEGTALDLSYYIRPAAPGWLKFQIYFVEHKDLCFLPLSMLTAYISAIRGTNFNANFVTDPITSDGPSRPLGRAADRPGLNGCQLGLSGAIDHPMSPLRCRLPNTTPGERGKLEWIENG